MKKTLGMGCIAACLILVSVALAKGAKTSDTPVTSTIAGSLVNGVPTYSIASDGAGSYVNGVNSVVSVLQASSGNWELDMKSSTVRRLVLDFSNPVSGTADTPPFTTGIVAPHVISLCSNNGVSYLNMNLTSLATAQCPLHIGWTDASGNTWNLAMNPGAPYYFTQTNWVLVTCTAADSTGACSHWTLSPTSANPNTNQPANVAHLFRVTTVKGKTVNEDHGDYYMTFAIDINRP